MNQNQLVGTVIAENIAVHDNSNYCYYNKCMEVTFDPAKDAANQAKHGYSLALAAELEWDTALVWVDTRFDYAELRMCALVLLEMRLFYVAFIDCSDHELRVISLRKATPSEVKRYVAEN